MPGSKSLSNNSPEATEFTNATGRLDRILAFQPDSGLILRFINMVERGTAPGIPIYFDLRDSNNNQLPDDTRLALQFRTNRSDTEATVSDVETNIQAWNSRTISEQQNEDYIDAHKVRLKGGGPPSARKIDVEDVEELRVAVDSSAQVDWTNSALYVDGAAVREFSD